MCKASRMPPHLLRVLARPVIILAALSLAILPAPAESRGRHYQPHHGADVWADLAHCESTHGKDPNLYGFTDATWRRMPERAGRARTHTPGEQLASAKYNLHLSGPRQWPYCGRRIGLQRHHAYPLPPITG